MVPCPSSLLIRGRALQRAVQAMLPQSMSARASTSLSNCSQASSSSSSSSPCHRRIYAQHRVDFSTAQVSSAEVDASSTRSDTLVSPEDHHKEEKERVRISDVLISDVLTAKHSYRWVDPVIHKDASVKEAIQTVIEGGLSGMMVVEEDPKDLSKKIVGLVTSRDLLRIMAAGIRDGVDAETIMNGEILQNTTPISQLVYGRPDETIGMCRTLMAKLGIKCLPILSSRGRVEGLITARDMSDYGLSAADRGGKKNYLKNVSERVGLSSDTSMAEPPRYMHAHLAMEQHPLFANVGVAELPHPFKTDSSVGSSQRDFGPKDPSTDPDLSEDAYFTKSLRLPDGKGSLQDVTYFGVADGVGSWREYHVDPREFSHKLMEECENILMETHRKNGSSEKASAIAPAEILSEAYDRVKEENIIGSSTACVAMFDNTRHQLHFSNLGDSGLIVLRHIDSEVAGSLKRDKLTPRVERASDLHVAFVSQQQLHSFNHPYQLGWTGEETEDKTSFKSARDACVTSVHIRRGDIIIMGTDGLFDNVDIEDIAKASLEWEQKCGFIRGGDIAAREQRWAMGNSLTLMSMEHVDGLASDLCALAREKSLDKMNDSPFAILAKENDIMWSGGMPDDCTIIVAHIVGRAPSDMMDPVKQ